jgi:ABC-type transport system substrate-binding protein
LGGLFAIALFFLLLHLKSRFYEPTISEGIVGNFSENELPVQVTSLISQGLMTIDKNSSPSANLVSAIDVSSDAKMYTLKLKDNLYWEDGTKIKASDIHLNFKDVTVTTPDDSTIVFKLEDSFSPFLSLLTRPILKEDTQIGIGPYKVTAISHDDIYVKKVVLKSKRQDLPIVIVRFYPNEKIAKEALKIGEVQSLFGINEPEELLKEKPYILLSQPNFTRLVTVLYNTKDAALSDENLRLALSFAAPAIPGEVEAKTPIQPHSWAYNDEVKDYLNNQDLAKQYLEKTKIDDQVITLTATSSLKEAGELVVKEWEKLGIKAHLRVESGIPQNFQALLIAQKIPVDPDQYALWHKLGQNNVTQYSHPRLDEDLEKARKTADYEQRKQRYSDFQKVLLDHAPATFLYFQRYNVVYTRKSENNLKKIIDIQLASLP